MKTSILGQIIDENAHANELFGKIQILQNEIQGLHQQMATATPADQAAINAQIQNHQQDIQDLQGQLATLDNKRASIIEEIETITNRRLLTYFSIHGSMSDRDSRIIEDFLYSNNVTKFDILVDSPGGFTDAAEKLIKICRVRTATNGNFDFRTIVVNQAKSAATLFALGSTKILLSKTAELGPVWRFRLM